MKYFIKSRVGAFPGYTLKQLLEEANKRTGYRMYRRFTKALQRRFSREYMPNITGKGRKVESSAR